MTAGAIQGVQLLAQRHCDTDSGGAQSPRDRNGNLLIRPLYRPFYPGSSAARQDELLDPNGGENSQSYFVQVHNTLRDDAF